MDRDLQLIEVTILDVRDDLKTTPAGENFEFLVLEAIKKKRGLTSYTLGRISSEVLSDLFVKFSSRAIVSARVVISEVAKLEEEIIDLVQFCILVRAVLMDPNINQGPRMVPYNRDEIDTPFTKLPESVFVDSFIRMHSIIEQKGQDYSSGRHTWSNFEEAAYLGSTTIIQTFIVPMAVKVSRLESLVRSGGNPNFESIGDTLLDLANYLVLLLAYARWVAEGKRL